MESRLQEKLGERRERAALTEISTKLSGLFTSRGLEADRVPGWVDETLQGFWSISTEPIETLTDEAAPEALDGWIEDLLRRHGVTDRVYIAGRPSLLPWLECQVPTGGWVSRVREAIEDPWIFLSQSLDVIVAVAEAEYQYEAHVGRLPQPTPTTDPDHWVKPTYDRSARSCRTTASSPGFPVRSSGTASPA